jgi:iron(III) transport system substrate-binding protein
VANPRFGTTRGHFAAFLALWGEQEYVTFLQELHDVLKGALLDGNATAAQLVGRGTLDLCATDTDDVYVRQVRGDPIDLTYPDLGDGGTLFIPCSAALLRGAPNPEAARTLIDFLTSAEVEEMLAASDSRNIPVREALRKQLKIALPPQSKLAYTRIADAMDRAILLAEEHLIK